MRNFTASEVINKEYKNARNFMTPDILHTQFSGGFAVELSQGEGMNRQPIFGVSVVEFESDNGYLRSTKRRTDLSGCHQSRAKAQEAIDELGD